MSRTLPFDPPPDEVVLAAVERAATDSPEWVREECEGAAFWYHVARHLELPENGRGSRWLPGALNRLARAGMLAVVEPKGHKAFVLTPDADAWLHALDSAGELPALPESPAHRRWREARTKARRTLPGAREVIRRVCGEALRLVEEDPATVSSDVWRDLAQCLDRAADRMEAVVHCLHEWDEPADQGEAKPPFAIAVKRSALDWDEPS